MNAGRSAVVFAACVLVLGTKPAAAYELRTSASASVVRPDRKGYTSFWNWGPGAGLGIDFIPDGSALGLALWGEYAKVAGRTRDALGDTLAVSPWEQVRVFYGLKQHLYLSRSRQWSITADLAMGRGVLDFGDVRIQGNRPSAQFFSGERLWGDLFTFGAGLEYVGERFGLFADMRSELFSGISNYTWNTKRIGLIWRARRSREED